MLVTFMGQSVKEFLFATLQLLIDHLVCRPVAPDLVSPSPPPPTYPCPLVMPIPPGQVQSIQDPDACLLPRI